MTVRFAKYWNGLHPGYVATFSERTERRLIGDGIACSTQTCGPQYTLDPAPLTTEEQADAQARLTAALTQYD